MQRQTKQRQTGYLQMSEIQATISRYLRASAGNCNFPTMHTIDCFIGMIQTGEATMKEAEKFSIGCEVKICNEASEVINGINLVNYEKIHHFDTSVFAGVVLDESSILKNALGKTKRLLVESYQQTPYQIGRAHV